MNLLLLALLAPQAAAATLTVDDGGAATYTSIQDAIDDASKGDTIKVWGGTYNESLDTSGKNLTFIGSGSSKTKVKGGSGAVLTISGGETVTLSGMRFTAGEAGISVRGSTASFSDITIDTNVGISSGAGIGVADGGIVSISDCTISGNEATGNFNGGGVYVADSSLELDSCEISGNAGRQGAGIYASASTLVLTDITLSGNEAATHGGGIRLIDGSTLDATRVDITGNTADSRGGAFSLVDSDSTWADSDMSDNSSGTGGGAMHLDGQLKSGTTFEGTIQGNISAGSGAAVYSENLTLGLSGTIADNTIDGSEDGGAIWISGTDLSLSSAEISGHKGVDGGAIYLNVSSSLTMSDVTLSLNEATGAGGALYAEGPVIGSTVVSKYNKASGAGGGWAVADADASCTSCTFKGNQAGTLGGGWFQQGGNADGISSSFSANSAASGGGIAIDGDGTDDPRVAYCTLESNTASADGGGLYNSGSRTLRLKVATLRANTATVTGGGAYIDSPGSLTVYKVGFWANSAEVGGGLYANKMGGGATELSDFGANIADTGAGGVFYNPTGAHDIKNSRFVGNQGAGMVLHGDTNGRFQVENVDVVGNDGGVMLEASSRSVLINLIAAWNGAYGLSSDGSTALADLSWSDSYGQTEDWAGSFDDLTGTDGNISSDPAYNDYAAGADPETVDLTLSTSSPCLDAGDPSLTDADGSRSDMGSYGGEGAAAEDDDGDGWSVEAGDCDDTDESIHPGADDPEGDGIDSDCDGVDGTGGGTDTGGIDDTGTDGGTDDTGTDDGGTDGGDTDGDGDGTGGTGGEDIPGREPGCACSSGSTAGASLLGWLALMLPLIRRRSRS